MDEIPAEIWKRIGDQAATEMNEICNKMYEEGRWTDDFTRVVRIPLPKKNNATECGDFRTTSLICHASKVMLEVPTKRIESMAKCLLGRN